MASRPRKSAVRPVYSSPPRGDQGQERGPGLAPSPISSRCYAPAPTLLARSGLVSPTYKGVGERTAWLMWATPPSVFHTARIQAEHMLDRGRKGAQNGVTWERSRASSSVIFACNCSIGLGVGKEILSGLSDRVGTPAQRRLSGPCPLCPTLVQMGSVQTAGRKCHSFPTSRGPGPGSPPLDAPL